MSESTPVPGIWRVGSCAVAAVDVPALAATTAAATPPARVRVNRPEIVKATGVVAVPRHAPEARPQAPLM